MRVDNIEPHLEWCVEMWTRYFALRPSGMIRAMHPKLQGFRVKVRMDDVYE